MNNNFATMTLDELLKDGGWDCGCGKHHSCGLKYLKVERGAVRYLPEALARFGLKKPFIVCDHNTKKAAWAQVKEVLENAGIEYKFFEFAGEEIEPDEHSMGSLVMHFDPACDVALAIGSGVINDCCKVLGHAVGIPSMVVGTAPSMDGYASNSSAMIRDRVKVSMYNACPVAIIADTDIIAQAPERMLWAGLGDMLAKYIAICEWRISNLITGEFYCENIAGLVRASLKVIVDNAPRLLERDPEIIGEVIKGLILSGVAMAFAEISRPASGLEHYFSHMWEMMALDRGTGYELHGIQVGVGTVLTLRIYDELRKMRPDPEVARNFIENFSQDEWVKHTKEAFGQAADVIIAQAERENKNDPAKHAVRFQKTVENWDTILKIIDEELPPTADIEALMKSLGMPMLPADIDVSAEDTVTALRASRDIRDKYLSSTMMWDMGILYTYELNQD